MDQVLSLVPGQNTTLPATVLKVEIKAGAQADFSAFRLFKDELVEKDEDFVFYGQPATTDGSIILSFKDTSAVFALDLSKLDSRVTKVILGVTTDLPNISRLGTLRLTLRANDSTILRCPLDDLERNRERALILCEFYQHNGAWKFRFVAQGFYGGLPQMAEKYGVELDDDSKPQDDAQPQVDSKTAQALAQDSNRRNNKLEYEREQSHEREVISPGSAQAVVNRSLNTNRTGAGKLNLTQQQPRGSLNLGSQQTEFFKINLNWNHGAATQSSFMSSLSAGDTPQGKFDLDLGAYIKLKNGHSTIVQALGNRFGSFNDEPFVTLEGDGQGKSADGTYLSVNPKYLNQISEIVIFTFFYEDMPDWKNSAAVLKIKLSGHPEVEMRLTDGDNTLALCALARITNEGQTLNFERLERYFYGHADMDSFFGWGFTWVPGTKD